MYPTTTGSTRPATGTDPRPPFLIRARSRAPAGVRSRPAAPTTRFLDGGASTPARSASLCSPATRTRTDPATATGVDDRRDLRQANVRGRRSAPATGPPAPAAATARSLQKRLIAATTAASLTTRSPASVCPLPLKLIKPTTAASIRFTVLGSPTSRLLVDTTTFAAGRRAQAANSPSSPTSTASHYTPRARQERPEQPEITRISLHRVRRTPDTRQPRQELLNLHHRSNLRTDHGP